MKELNLKKVRRKDMYKASQIITAFVGVIGILGAIFSIIAGESQALIGGILSLFVIYYVYQTVKRLKAED